MLVATVLFAAGLRYCPVPLCYNIIIVPSRRPNRILEFPEILRQFCRAAGIEAFSLLGQSLGACYALRCAQVSLGIWRRFDNSDDDGT